MIHSFIDWIGYWVVKSIARLMNLLPLEAALGIARFSGMVCYYFHRRRRVAYVNLKAAFSSQFTPKQLKKIARRTYTNFAQVGVEIFRFPLMDKAYGDEYIDIPHFERIPHALKKGKGAILLTAHFGNWELQAIASALRGFPMKVLAREQKHSRLNDLLVEFRSAQGNETIGKGMALREIVKALRDNNIVGMVSDQSGGSDGMYLDFFGRRTTTPPGAISIALRTGCVVLPCFIIRKPKGRHCVDVNEPLTIPHTGNQESDIKEGLHNYLRLLEEYIRQYPDQWLWGHKRWKHTLDRSILVLSDEKAGHESQSQAVLDMCGIVADEKHLQIKKEVCRVAYKSSFHRKLLFMMAPFLIPFAQGRITFLRHFLTVPSYEKLSTHYADVIIACGSSTIPISLILKRENAARTIVIMKPPYPYNLFSYDVMLVPYHDRLSPRKKKVIRLRTALSPTHPQKLAAEGKKLKEELGLTDENIMSVLIGGDTKDYIFKEKYLTQALEVLIQIAREHNYYMVVTTSRRTRADIIALVKEKLSREARCKLLVIPTEKNVKNVVFGMIDIAQIIIATEDSISMVSESVQSGKPVIVLKMAPQGMPHKHVRFQNNLIKEGMIQVSTYENLKSTFFNILQQKKATHDFHEEKAHVYHALRKVL